MCFSKKKLYEYSVLLYFLILQLINHDNSGNFTLKSQVCLCQNSQLKERHIWRDIWFIRHRFPRSNGTVEPQNSKVARSTFSSRGKKRDGGNGMEESNRNPMSVSARRRFPLPCIPLQTHHDIYDDMYRNCLGVTLSMQQNREKDYIFTSLFVKGRYLSLLITLHCYL